MLPSLWRARRAVQWLPVAALVAVPASATAQQSGTITGIVRSALTDSVLPGALVSLEGGGVNLQADPHGRFLIRSVPRGRARLTARLLGYTPERLTVSVVAGDTTVVDVRLRPAATELAELTVIGTDQDLDERQSRLERVPGSVALVQSAQLRETRQANLKDALGYVPGVYVQSRFGAADESQISIRGSGLRNNFHARGVNLLVNGMPYRNADGFTDFESLELLTTESIEVYKGANALRYGGSTLGGAINLETRTGYSSPSVSVATEGGSFGFLKSQLASGGTGGKLDWYGSVARTTLDGYRDWAQQGRTRLNAHLGYVLSPAADLRAFYFFARASEQLPGALAAGELDAEPTAADPENRTGHWGRNYDLHHLGVQLRSQLGDHQRLEISPYAQYRNIDHPIFQVIAQESRDWGAEVRYENSAALFGRTNRLTLGLQPAWLDMDNRQFENLAGTHGELRKDQKDQAVSLALYGENALALTPRLTAVLGARVEHAIRKSRDFYLADGDQADHRVFDAVLPRVGMLYALPTLGGSLYANASRSSEPPHLLELNSRAVPGVKDHRAQKAWQLELGIRGGTHGVRWDVAAFDAELDDEVLNVNVQPFPGAPFTVPAYRNAARTRHYGLETGLEVELPVGVARVAYTFARYRFVSDSLFDGNEIPGAPRHHLAAQVRLQHRSGLALTPSVEWVPSAYFVDSGNTERNAGWATLGLRGEYAVTPLGLTAFVAGQNLTDRRYAASVQVDNAAGRSFEPADGRAFYAGFQWSR
ncbi:MAG: TonB-dependent receptor domain-containing protein [Gemmatimonadales bacterium]